MRWKVNIQIGNGLKEKFFNFGKFCAPSAPSGTDWQIWVLFKTPHREFAMMYKVMISIFKYSLSMPMSVRISTLRWVVWKFFGVFITFMCPLKLRETVSHILKYEFCRNIFAGIWNPFKKYRDWYNYKKNRIPSHFGVLPFLKWFPFATNLMETYFN